MIYYKVTIQRWGGVRTQWVRADLYPAWETQKRSRGYHILYLERYAKAE